MYADVSQYTPMQVLAALKAQGYDDSTARRMMKTMGPMAIPEAQGSNVIPNVSEGVGLAGASHLVSKYAGMPGPAKFILPMVAGNIGNIAGAELSGTNYYDQASTPQILADIGGSIGGGMIGERFAQGYSKAKANNIDDRIKRQIDLATKRAGSKKQAGIVKQQLEDAVKRNNIAKSWTPVSKAAAQKGVTNAVAKRAAGKIAGRVAGMGAGRLAGGALGAFAGPAGMIVGSAIGGYLMPKLFANAEEKALDEDAGMDTGTAALLAGGAMLASPLGAGTRKMISDANMKYSPRFDDKTLLELPGHYTQKPRDFLNEKIDELYTTGVGQQAKRAQTALRDSYNNSLNKSNAQIDANRAKLDAEGDANMFTTGYRNTKDAIGRTSNMYGAIADSIEDFGAYAAR